MSESRSGVGAPRQAPEAPTRNATVLIYSHDASVRDRVRNALGTRPAAWLSLDLEDAETGEDVVARCDQGGVDVAVLDGEAWPTGGLGLCRQLKYELDAAPPVLAILGRRDDAWLATWSQCDAVVMHPIDAVQVTEAVLSLLAPAADVATASH